MTRTAPIVAIDGPVGAGKSTTAREAARRLGFLYIDTGAMYRAVTLDVLGRGVDPADEPGVAVVVEQSDVRLVVGDDGQRTILNDADVTACIRDRDVTAMVSAVSAQKAVRNKMIDLQRHLGAAGGVVMEGRDIGTVVFPDAECKIFLDAAVEVRARRRHDELAAKGVDVPFDTLVAEIKERDRHNTERALSPLRPADDAIRLDTTGLTFDQQVDAVVSLARRAMEAPRKTAGNPPRLSYRITRGCTRLLYRFLYRITWDGEENIPAEGGAIIAANHASLADPPIVGAAMYREGCWMAKQELFRVPVVSWILRLTNSIPVNRSGYTRSALERVVGLLREGYAVVMFPEGTRTKNGKLQEPKAGVGMAAVMADVPVVPCWIEGSYRVKPFVSKITIHFLPPFHPREIGGETKKEHYLLVSERIMCDIASLEKSHNGRA